MKTSSRNSKKKVKKSVKVLTRKELRKQKSVQKKENKRLFFSGQFVNAEIGGQSKDVTQQKNNEEKSPKVKLRTAEKLENVKSICRPDAVENRRKEIARQNELQNSARKQRNKQLKLDNEEEQRKIAYFEKKLRLNKSKDKQKSIKKIFDDGLDYVLEFCVSDEEKEEETSRVKQKEDSNLEEYSESEDSTLDSNEEEDETENEAQPSVVTQDYTEDIYGRKLDKNGGVIQESQSDQSQKYIPPHQRALSIPETDNRTLILERLRRNCKGHLNRLSEHNLHKIANNIENLYMENSRNDMNNILTELLSEALIGQSISNERMVQEHIVLLAYLHAHVGNEIGAHFLQFFVRKFDEFICNIDQIQIEDKKLNNLLLALSYMYIFKIYEHGLLIEFITRLADNLCEKAIECMLIIYQTVGFKLRKDDPLAFKQMLTMVQKKIASSPMELKENLRLKFMIEVLNAVKNNNINKIPKYDPELAESLRKLLKGMLRNDKYVTTLNITMPDLLRADKVGKWWIVGSAWSGNVNDLGNAAKSVANQNKSVAKFSEKLLELAKRQKMNTDDRRNIFCIIMGAEDFVDAFEKILHLRLKDQRSVAYVTLHCALNEAKWNPYYAHLAQKFCTYDRKYQLAFQFASWDRINELKSLAKNQIRILGNFLLHLILQGGLVLSVLKVIDFVKLDKISFTLTKQIMLGLLLTKTDNDLQSVFERVAINPKLNTFKNSIRLFINHFLLENCDTSHKLTDDKIDLLKKRIELVDNVLAYVDL